MNRFEQLGHLFRAPKYPVIVASEGVLVAANSARPLYEKLSQFDIVEKEH